MQRFVLAIDAVFLVLSDRYAIVRPDANSGALAQQRDECVCRTITETRIVRRIVSHRVACRRSMSSCVVYAHTVAFLDAFRFAFALHRHRDGRTTETANVTTPRQLPNYVLTGGLADPRVGYVCLG
jgi:hypothetical protein